MEKSELEKYLSDKAREIGEHLSSEHDLPVDVFINTEKDGLEYADGHYLNTETVSA